MLTNDPIWIAVQLLDKSDVLVIQQSGRLSRLYKDKDEITHDDFRATRSSIRKAVVNLLRSGGWTAKADELSKIIIE